MKPQNEVFESGDVAALICVGDEKMHSIVAEQLSSLGYEMQSGLFREDVTLRLQTNAYDLLVVEEGFENAGSECSPIVRDCRDLSPEHRRSVFIVLIGRDLRSANGMQAFQHSVDLVVATEDLERLASILRRNYEDYQLRYQPFLECAERVFMS